MNLQSVFMKSKHETLQFCAQQPKVKRHAPTRSKVHAMWFVWVAVAMAQEVQGLDLPDVVGIARNVARWAGGLWHGTENHGTVRHASQPRVTWPMLRQPQLLPTAHEVKAMSGAEKYNRVTYYWELFTLIFVVVVLLGTLIMVCGPRVKGCLRTKTSYLRVEVAGSTGRTAANSNGQILGVTSQKRLLAVAFGATLSACTVACAYSVQTERLSRTTGLDFEMYALLLAAGGTDREAEPHDWVGL
eukprot:s444_g33.t1